MEFTNLEINVLALMCTPDDDARGSDMAGSIGVNQVLDTFSDIPVVNIREALQTMVTDGLIRMDLATGEISITDAGIHRLQGSIACQTYRFSTCRCGKSD